MPFRAGLVGGHCIGVDPYYLTHKAQAIGYSPEIILAGRRLNDSMGEYVVTQLVKTIIKKRMQVEGAKVLILGSTSKENCPDVRNTKVINIVHELKEYNVEVNVYDPWVDAGDRTTLNTLFTALQENLALNGVGYAQEAVYQDFREGDVLHSQADISKIQNALGYNQQFDIIQGIEKAMPW